MHPTAIIKLAVDPIPSLLAKRVRPHGRPSTETAVQIDSGIAGTLRVEAQHNLAKVLPGPGALGHGIQSAPERPVAK